MVLDMKFAIGNVVLITKTWQQKIKNTPFIDLILSKVLQICNSKLVSLNVVHWGRKNRRIFRVRREVADDHLVAIGASARSKNFSSTVAYLFEAVKSQEPTTVSAVVVAASRVLAFSGASGWWLAVFAIRRFVSRILGAALISY